MHNAMCALRFVVCLLGCDTVWSGWYMQTFQRHLSLLPAHLQYVKLPQQPHLHSIYNIFLKNQDFPYIFINQSMTPCEGMAVQIRRFVTYELKTTGHIDSQATSTGFSWFPCVYKQMLRWFPRFQVATTCFSWSPPDLNLLVTNFIFCINVK